jgi:hypothetical protein
MILSGLLGLLVGLLLGGRFKIFAAVPVQVFAMTAMIAPALFGAASFRHQLMTGVAFCLALQAGYVVRLATGGAPARSAPLKPHQV